MHEKQGKNNCVLPHGGHQKCTLKMCTSLNNYIQGIPWKGKLEWQLRASQKWSCKVIRMLSARVMKIKTLLVNHFMEDSSEDKRQECQYPQESMRVKCILKSKMQAKVRTMKEILHQEIKKQCNYAMNAFMKYASAKLLQNPNVKYCNIMLACVCVCVCVCVCTF